MHLMLVESGKSWETYEIEGQMSENRREYTLAKFKDFY